MGNIIFHFITRILQAVVMNHSCGVFHSPAHKLTTHNLIVFIPWIGDPGNRAKKANHFGGVPKNLFGVGFISGFYVITQRNWQCLKRFGKRYNGGVVKGFPRTYGEHAQIHRMFVAHLPDVFLQALTN